ncbi:MAG: hypothetical protein JO013_02450 [Alphaproteobacteria bacterium]|nr:hypothetical protein [Alphaproteobacteria bacterium]
MFDGSGKLSPDANPASATIAEFGAKQLRESWDNGHQAGIPDAPSMIEGQRSIIPLPDEERMVAQACKLLDSNNCAEGDIRSAINRRAVAPGQDGQRSDACGTRTLQVPASRLVTVQNSLDGSGRVQA